MSIQIVDRASFESSAHSFIRQCCMVVLSTAFPVFKNVDISTVSVSHTKTASTLILDFQELLDAPEQVGVTKRSPELPVCRRDTMQGFVLIFSMCRTQYIKSRWFHEIFTEIPCSKRKNSFRTIRQMSKCVCAYASLLPPGTYPRRTLSLKSGAFLGTFAHLTSRGRKIKYQFQLNFFA